MLCKDNKKEADLQTWKTFNILCINHLAQFGAIWQVRSLIFGKNFNISNWKFFSWYIPHLAVSDFFVIFMSSFHAQPAPWKEAAPEKTEVSQSCGLWLSILRHSQRNQMYTCTQQGVFTETVKVLSNRALLKTTLQGRGYSEVASPVFETALPRA